ncbi:MAG: bifunctional (p)ppGpp synthetase/guanosine-3',5'-bis(diphosphate) 3'-pyrophosphohydrolase [Burkholderiaceae bacterium]
MAQFPAPSAPVRSVSLAPLMEMLSAYLGPTEIKRIKDAYRFSDEAHLGQFRSSGEAYISHPIAVAEICAGMKLDANAMMAALLHDVMEDQGIKKEILIERFGAQVADLVDGLSKLDKIEFRDSQEAQAENFRKMLLAMARDVRVILIKLADRLHNMRTLMALPPNKRRRIARETLEIYTPIAHRLGLNAIYRELQDLAFANLYPNRYEVLKKAILAARGNRREVVGKTLEAVRGALPAAGLRAEVYGREKTIYGVYRKMIEKKLSFSQVLDVYGFRIVVPDHASCYLTLGALHALFKPVSSKFKDYIAIPKINGYQSLHTTVLGPFGTPVEFQIRTQEMHRIAESGVAAHWLYKDGDESLSEVQKNTHQWLQSLLDIQNQTGDSAEFLEHIKVDLFPDAVYVFTPKSTIITLPRGATPVDFAYQIHTDIGNQCIAAKINGELSPLRSELQSGDVVEVITSAESRPNPSWLNFVRTGRARSEIRHYLKTMKYEESVDLGARLLDQALKQIDRRYDELTAEDWQRVQYESGAKTREELLADLGLGRRIAAVVARRFILSGLGGATEAELPHDSVPHPVLISGTEGMSVMLAPCCRPIPGDDIFGYIRRGYGLVVHTADCPTAARQRTRDPERWIDSQWERDIDHTRLFDVKLDVSLRNERGVLAKTAVEISEAGSNISHVSMDDEAEEITQLHFIVQVSDRAHLARLIRRLRRLPEMARIVRVKS